MLPFLPIFLVGVFLALVGWGGLVLLILTTLPTIVPRWLFFFLLTLAASGTALPIIAFLHRRFPSDPPAETGVIVREAVLAGVFADLAAWLQLGKVLNAPLAGFLAAGILVIEILLRMYERTRFKPKESLHE
ncbi:MAG TPA: hypothetical protein VIO36_03230 [Anaerolineaceae bacterium]